MKYRHSFKTSVSTISFESVHPDFWMAYANNCAACHYIPLPAGYISEICREEVEERTKVPIETYTEFFNAFKDGRSIFHKSDTINRINGKALYLDFIMESVKNQQFYYWKTN